MWSRLVAQYPSLRRCKDVSQKTYSRNSKKKRKKKRLIQETQKKKRKTYSSRHLGG